MSNGLAIDSQTSMNTLHLHYSRPQFFPSALVGMVGTVDLVEVTSGLNRPGALDPGIKRPELLLGP